MNIKSVLGPLAVSLVLGWSAPASANFAMTQGSGTNVFAFDSATTPAGTANCAASNTECFAHVLINTAGSPIGVSGTPLFVSGAGSSFPVTGTFWQTTQPISAASLPLPAGAATAANQIGANASFSVTPTVQNAAYSASNALGGLQTVSVFRTTTQPSGILNGITLASKGGFSIGVTFYVFDTNPTGTTCTDKTAFSLAAADVAKLAMAPFVVAPAAAQGTSTTAAQQPMAISIKNQDGTPTTNLYICPVVDAAVTPASTSDVTIKFSLAQD